MYQRIVVPLDGSEIAERALVEAEKMALLTRAPIHLVRVIDFTGQDMFGAYGMMADPTTISTLLADETDSARQYLETIVRRAMEKGHQATSELLRGPVAHQLVAVARPGDLFVMASHGRSGISRWFMGSVAEEVVRRSPVPVLLLKALATVRNARPGGTRTPAGRAGHWRAIGECVTLLVTQKGSATRRGKGEIW